jgi:hypothetical protein
LPSGTSRDSRIRPTILLFPVPTTSQRAESA